LIDLSLNIEANEESSVAPSASLFKIGVSNAFHERLRQISVDLQAIPEVDHDPIKRLC
jgi:hypothetical protein